MIHNLLFSAIIMYSNQASTHTALLPSLGGGYTSGQLKSQPAREISVPVPASQADLTKNTGTNETLDRITLSPQSRHLAAGLAQNKDDAQGEKQDTAENQPRQNNQQTAQLNAEKQRAVEQLKQRDMEVRSHEQAHLANAGQYAAGSAQYTYQKGPDGKRYAVGGEVPIDISKESTPEATLQKMQTVRKAALAPANPSSADRQIAATATQKEAQARQEMQKASADESAARPSKELETTVESTEPENSATTPSLSRQAFTAVA
ncbi:putative metalloprotease CJM1_0395 family protein [Desulfogranum marinum]|uniref:putative metalloprotease CJM1_0395 family protein n=1 Tax=Desulfogranum marinum TaxID=453220 RepID=UPI0029C88435|nr:putative metalloprotease CJM1_0395 family protein [Desulfogranum marinum]